MSGTLRFAGIEVWQARFPLRMTFSHHLASRNGVDTLIVLLRDSAGRTGCGQVLPRDYLTGETLAGAAEDIRARWWPELAGLEINADAGREEAAGAFAPLFAQADARRLNASYAGADVAARMLLPAAGALAESFPLVGAVSAASPVKAGRLARLMRRLGFRRFKVKVGRDAAADQARLAAVRRAVGPDAWLAVDANAAWDWDEAVERMRGFAPYRVAVAEEPLVPATAREADFSRLEKTAGMEVMADESLCTLADAHSLLARGSPAWWNVRLAKNGGITGVEHFAALARARGVKIYGGILVGETGLLAAAGMSVFPASGAECGEYGFPRVFLRGDPSRGSPAGYRGCFRAGLAAGDVRCDAGALGKRAELLYRLER